VTIGFGLGPRINAAGRLRSALLAYDLLSADEMSQAARLAEELNTLNQERQQKTEMMQGWAEESMSGDPSAQRLLFAADARFEQGVVGLVASRLTEMYYRPSVVVQIGEDESHGSCRSIPEFHITHALDRCADLLERHGGHAAAAGFTVRSEHIDPLRERLQEIAGEMLAGQSLLPSLDIDAELPLSDVSFETADALAGLEPTGEANRQPLFVARDLTIVDRRTVGDGKHLKLTVTDGTATADAIAFRLGQQLESLPARIDIAFHLEADEWNDRRRLQLNVRDFRPAAGLFEGGAR
jgi:single-stranded-DNA-specific exonuclease